MRGKSEPLTGMFRPFELGCMGMLDGEHGNWSAQGLGCCADGRAPRSAVGRKTGMIRQKAGVQEVMSSWERENLLLNV